MQHNQDLDARQAIPVVTFSHGRIIEIIGDVIKNEYPNRTVGNIWNNWTLEEQLEYVEWFTNKYNEADLCSCLAYFLDEMDTDDRDLRNSIKEFHRRTEFESESEEDNEEEDQEDSENEMEDVEDSEDDTEGSDDEDDTENL
jgi:hypothetical protein